MARLLAVAVALKWAQRSAPNCPRRGPATALCRRGKNAKRTRVKTSSWERRGDHRNFAADLTGGLSCRDLIAGTCRISRPRTSQAALEAAGVLSRDGILPRLRLWRCRGGRWMAGGLRQGQKGGQFGNGNRGRAQPARLYRDRGAGFCRRRRGG